MGAACFPTKPSSKLTLCAKNIAQLLEKTATDPAVSLDFISFQEAARWKELVKNTPKSLQKMSYDVQKAGSEEIITFFNSNKYTLKRSIKSSFTKGRPFQILIFKEKLIYINLHLGHHKTKAYLTTKLSNALLQNIPKKSERQSLKNYRIIAVGDFNDHSNPPQMRLLYNKREKSSGCNSPY